VEEVAALFITAEGAVDVEEEATAAVPTEEDEDEENDEADGNALGMETETRRGIDAFALTSFVSDADDSAGLYGRTSSMSTSSG
jgi:hypothetical protein